MFKKIKDRIVLFFSDSQIHGGADSSVFAYVAWGFVLLATLFFFRFIERYLDKNEQLLIGVVSFAVLFIFGRIAAFQRPPLRLLFIVLAGFITLRYFIWRTTETLIYTGFWDLIAMTILYLAEVYTFIIHLLGLFINSYPLENRIVPLPDDESKYPVVDIFIPTYTEDEEIVRVTAIAALQIDYPRDKFRVHILNDGSTHARRANPALSDEAFKRHFSLKRMAKELGINYLTRETNKSAKAGNVNHALTKTSGDLVLILDCDHVPTRDILKNTVGWFLKEEKLFLVQTPHFFINPTPIEKNVIEASNVAGENDMFYRIIHRGLNAWNSSYFCGSAAVLRRKYLMEAGGISGFTITEDAETSFLLHSRGYSSVYIRRPMVCGLSPETFDDYIIQRTRWAQGMTQLFILNNPLFEKGLKFAQRLCYFNSCFFWFFGMPRFIFYIAPSAFLLLGLKVYHASVAQIFAFAIPHIFATFVAMDFLYGKARKPFFSEIYESVQSLFLMPAVFSAILNPKKPTFKITPKGKRLETTYLNPMAATFFVVVAVNVAVLPMAVMRWINYPEYRDVIMITGAWCLYNIFLAICSLGAFWESKQIRGHHRIKAFGEAEVYFVRLKETVRVALEDVSLTGLGFSGKFPFDVKQLDDIIIKYTDGYGETFEFGARIHRNVKRGERFFCGTEFTVTRENFPTIVRFVYGDSNRWVELWKHQMRPVTTRSLLKHFFIGGLRGCKESFVLMILFSYDKIKRIAGAVAFAASPYLRRLVGV